LVPSRAVGPTAASPTPTAWFTSSPTASPTAVSGADEPPSPTPAPAGRDRPRVESPLLLCYGSGLLGIGILILLLTARRRPVSPRWQVELRGKSRLS
ncbi:MAG: hypothetical protein ABWK53_06080, partial [Anaerolineales bacterium]